MNRSCLEQLIFSRPGKDHLIFSRLGKDHLIFSREEKDHSVLSENKHLGTLVTIRNVTELIASKYLVIVCKK